MSLPSLFRICKMTVTITSQECQKDSNEIMNIKHVALCLVIAKAQKMENIYDLKKLSTYYIWIIFPLWFLPMYFFQHLVKCLTHI